MDALIMAPQKQQNTENTNAQDHRPRYIAAHPPAPERPRGPWCPRLSTGPWFAQLASYFPPYYSRPAIVGVAVLFVVEYAFHALAPRGAAASWAYLVPLCLGFWACGLVWVFVLVFLCFWA